MEELKKKDRKSSKSQGSRKKEPMNPWLVDFMLMSL